MIKRNLYIGIVSLIALLLIIFGGILLKGYEYQKKLVHQKDPGFSQSEKQLFIDRYKDDEQKLSALSSDTDNKVKYRLTMDIGLQHYTLGDYDLAKKYYLQAIKIMPDNAYSYSELFTVEKSMNDYLAAKNSIEKAIELSPMSAIFWQNRIQLMREHFNATNTDLISMFNEALQKTNNGLEVVILYAHYLEDNRDLLGAVSQWKKAIEKNPAGQVQYQAEITRIQSLVK